ncbi:MAG TPA: hypothetical protein VGI79_02345 [Caulobacteraceae bacterium]|jgi:hypothetical protein
MGRADLGRGLAAIAGACATLVAPSARASGGWPNALPAQPLVQAERLCAPGVVALNRRCHVADFTKLGETPDGRPWYYAFYATRWADRHGRMERGFPVLFYLQRPATLRLGLWINDEPGLAGRWATTPPPRPVMILRPEGDFVGFTLKAIRGPDDQRLFRRDKLRWRDIDVLHRQDEDQAKIDAVTPRGCEAADDGAYDWAGFKLLLPLRESLSHTPCGFVTADLTVKDNHLSLAMVSFSRAEPKDRPPQTATSSAPPPLTPAPGGHTSPLR